MKTQDVVIRFNPDGSAKCLWTDRIDLTQIGNLKVRRASRIEFDNASGLWEVWIQGQAIAIFRATSRQACLDFEHETMNRALAEGRI